MSFPLIIKAATINKETANIIVQLILDQRANSK
jgi:hypothetical protein